MSNSISTVSDLERMAHAIAKSNLFGVKTTDQALALMLVAQAEGRHPALAARDYDIVQGKPAKKAEAMMRDFLESGGKVEWHKLDDAVADATFTHPSGGSVRIAWDMKRAIAAGLGGKDMWKKYPRQMLRSRTVSEGIRTVCPMATSGMYVPEEVQDFVREKNITPTAGADEAIPVERQNEVKSLADKVVEWINSGSLSDAVMEIENAGLDSEEKIYLWTFFDSKQRSALKKEAARQKAESEAKALPPPDTISEAQRKRLEARIGDSSVDRERVKEYCRSQFGKEHFAELNNDEYQQIDETLESLALSTQA